MIRYILVEGASDVAFIAHYCQHLGFTPDDSLMIIDMQGKGGLAKNMLSLEPELKKGAKIAVILDADTNMQQRREDAKAILGEEIPLFLMPDDGSTGELETLLLSTTDEDIILNCFEDYIACLEDEGIDSSSVDNKAKLYAYTKLTKGVQPDKSFGINLWDFEHKNFQAIATFLQRFVSDTE